MSRGEFIIVDDPEPLYEPTEEEEHNYWNGIGFITFFVEQNIPKQNILEIEIDDYDGCVGGAIEMVGADYFIKDMLGLDIEHLKEGHTYTLDHITVYWMRGDGWNTDDDVEYSFNAISSKIEWKRWLKQKLTNIWWQNIGWRIENARRKH